MCRVNITRKKRCRYPVERFRARFNKRGILDEEKR